MKIRTKVICPICQSEQEDLVFCGACEEDMCRACRDDHDCQGCGD